MSFFDAGRWTSEGQEIAAGWDNTGGLTPFTSLVGTDSRYFLPVNDRPNDDQGGYTPGVIQNLTTGGIYTSGFPVVRIKHPWISDGQIKTLKTYQGNCTLKHHIEDSVGITDVQTSNVIFNLDLTQTTGLTRKGDGWVDFVSTFVVVEVIS